MKTNTKIHQLRLQEWADRFSAQKSSGLTVRAWCEENGLTIHKFFYWKRALKDELARQILPDIVPLALPAPDSAFSVSTISSATCTTCASNKVNFTINDLSIGIDSSVPEEFLTTLIKAVRHA